jgi:hypothetical protein
MIQPRTAVFIMVMCALNKSHTLLLASVIDLFRGLGPLANHFLFGIHPDLAPDPLVFQSATSQQAYNNLTSKAAPSGLTHQTDTSWSSNSAHLPCGHTYHSWFPTNWMCQTLGTNNLNLAFAQHLLWSIHKKYSPIAHHPNNTITDPYPIGCSPLFRPASYYKSNSVDDCDS